MFTLTGESGPSCMMSSSFKTMPTSSDSFHIHPIEN